MLDMWNDLKKVKRLNFRGGVQLTTKPQITFRKNNISLNGAFMEKVRGMVGVEILHSKERRAVVLRFLSNKTEGSYSLVGGKKSQARYVRAKRLYDDFPGATLLIGAPKKPELLADRGTEQDWVVFV